MLRAAVAYDDWHRDASHILYEHGSAAFHERSQELAQEQSEAIHALRALEVK